MFTGRLNKKVVAFFVKFGTESLNPGFLPKRRPFGVVLVAAMINEAINDALNFTSSRSSFVPLYAIVLGYFLDRTKDVLIVA